MRSEWLIHEAKDHLIIFFAGWGMDARPFRHITSERSDVIVLFDYRDMTATDSLSELPDYKSTNLAAWSLGVAAAHHIANKLPFRIDQSVAISGTPYPAHDEFGIPTAIFDGTNDALNEKNLNKFYRRMCQDRETLRFFHQHAPERDLKELQQELSVLRNLKPEGDTVFQRAVIYQDDRIIPPENQRSYWQKTKAEIINNPGPHFPFNKYTLLEDFFNELS